MSTLEAAVTAAAEAGVRIDTVLADRAYGNSTCDDVLDRLKSTDRVIPRQGKADPVQHTRGWRCRYRYRAGCERRISHLKRRHGLAHTRLKHYKKPKSGSALGVLTQNLDRIVALTGKPGRIEPTTPPIRRRRPFAHRSTVFQGGVASRRPDSCCLELLLAPRDRIVS